MKLGKVKVAWEWDTIVPHGNNLATKEEPVIVVIEVSQRCWCSSAKEREYGISVDELDQDVMKEALYEELCSDLPSNCPEYWPDIGDLDLRWLPGSDRLSAWIDAILMPKD